MSRAIEQYLDRVMIYANRAGDEAAQVRSELQDHLLEKIDQLKDEGVAAEDAVFQAIEDHGHPRVVGYGLRPRFPLIDIRTHGTARGVIAIGPRAVGIFAFGGLAVGVFAFGGFALGGIGIGGICATLLFAWGGMAFVPTGVAYAGMAVGLVAIGGLACGVVINGGAGAGLWAPDAHLGIVSYYTAENVPPILRFADGLATNQWLFIYMTVPLIALFIPLFIFMLVMTKREERRVGQADPWLVE